MSESKQEEQVAAVEPPPPKEDDPMQEEMQRLATEKQTKKRAAAAEKARNKRAEEEATEARRRDAELRQRELEHAERVRTEKKHLELEKLRMERDKINAKAVKQSAAAQAQREIDENLSEEGAAKEKEDLMRKVSLFRERLGVHGTGKRITVDTPLHMLKTEFELCNSQMNLQRAEEMPRQFFVETARAFEIAAARFVDFRGTTDEFDECIERGKNAEPNSFEWQLNRAMMQCSINYSHLFAVRPELFIVGSFVKMAQERARLNNGHAREMGAEDVPPDMADRINRFMADDSDEE